MFDIIKKKKPIVVAKKIKGTITSREYKIYMGEEQWAGRTATLYEKLAKKSRKIIEIKPNKDLALKLQKAIDFAHLNMEPTDAMSFAFGVGFFGSLLLILLMVLGALGLPGLDVTLGVLAIAMIVPLAYFLMVYPVHLKKKFEVRTGSEIVTMILYMAIYMRDTPNMEGALRFAADNLTGPLAYELRKLIWDIEIGTFASVDTALMDYAQKWSDNKAFMESLQAMRESLTQVEEKRMRMLDEAVSLILNDTVEKADKYARDLKMPITVIHALGVVLPVMGLVLFPMIAIFLNVPPMALFIGYDIILPAILLFIVMNVLQTRPPTFSSIDVSTNPNAPPRGKFAIYGKTKKRFVSALPFGILIGLIIVGLGTYMFLTVPEDSIEDTLMPSIIIVAGIASGFAVYYLASSQQNLKIRKDTRNIEDEFREALFRLGNQVSSGRPIESALERSLDQMGELSIREMFKKAMDNIKNLGMTFEASFFDKTYGAIRYYPSKLVNSVMKTVVRSTQRGLATASQAMISISLFLRRVHDTQTKVEENMSDVTSSMQFQAYFLSPMVAGIVVTMAIMVIRIVKQIGPSLTGIQDVAGGASGLFGFMGGMWDQMPITSGVFQLIVGIYMIESGIILSRFVNGIQNGEDETGLQDLTGSVLLIGTIVYIVSLLITLLIFGPMTEGIV
ncbi:MAG: hypothetical protein ABIG30_03865 [Candidatus Aenigmatarchaeota archaeon]